MSHKALPGFRDFYPVEYAERDHIVDTWRRVARAHGFLEYDGPPLEPLDLYTQKSGDEIVGQLYDFVDKGGRHVALRPEMTPTFARMVAARAKTMPRPVRWFAVPQLFRYERQQKGRLREHFQLNVDIVGESDALADAELLSVAVRICTALGLTREDFYARVSDRRLLNALLAHLGIAADAWPAVYAVLDKLERQPREVSREKLAAAGLAPSVVDAVLGLGDVDQLGALRAAYGADAGVAEALDRLDAYHAHLVALGVAPFFRLDLTIVRGLAYYTGIVFELFDAKGEFRAICGGGRYDALLGALGGADLPALGFGMGDVVLGELLRSRGKLAVAPGASLAVEVVPAEGTPPSLVLRTVEALRAADVPDVAITCELDATRLATRRTSKLMDDARRRGVHVALVVATPATGERGTTGAHVDASWLAAPAPTVAAPRDVPLDRLLADTGAARALLGTLRAALDGAPHDAPPGASPTPATA